MFYLNSDINKILNESKDILNFYSGKKILITGGRGFLGRYFTEVFYRLNTFIEKPVDLIVLDNLITGEKLNSQNQYKNFEFLIKDACEPFDFKEHIDLIIHAAGIASPYYYRKKPIETLDVAIKGTRNSLDLAKKHNSKVIFFSSSEIYGDPDPKQIPIKENYRGNISSMGPRACYDESKRIGETLCYIYNNSFDVHTNIIRPFNVYGPGMNQKDYRVLPNFISNIVNNKDLNIYGTGKQTRTYCYISDAIEGFLRIIAKGVSGEAYNIGNNKPEISVIELVSLLQKIHQKKFYSKKINYPDSYPEDEPQRRCPDIAKAKKDLNYFPKVNLEDGLRNYLKWAKNNYKIYKRN